MLEIFATFLKKVVRKLSIGENFLGKKAFPHIKKYQLKIKFLILPLRVAYLPRRQYKGIYC